MCSIHDMVKHTHKTTTDKKNLKYSNEYTKGLLSWADIIKQIFLYYSTIPITGSISTRNKKIKQHHSRNTRRNTFKQLVNCHGIFVSVRSMNPLSMNGCLKLSSHSKKIFSGFKKFFQFSLKTKKISGSSTSFVDTSLSCFCLWHTLSYNTVRCNNKITYCNIKLKQWFLTVWYKNYNVNMHIS